jgi:chitinase
MEYLLTEAFATPNASSTLTWDSDSQSILKRLLSAKRSSGKSTKIVLSVGESFHSGIGMDY